MFQSFPQFLPFWLLGAPLVLALLDLMRTPRSHSDRNHSTMGGQIPMPVGGSTVTR